MNDETIKKYINKHNLKLNRETNKTENETIDPKGLRDLIMKEYKERTINSAELVSLITFWYLASSISKLEIYNVSCLYIK